MNDALERVRRHCLSLPEVTERLSHGSPTCRPPRVDRRAPLDRDLAWNEIAGAIEGAYACVAPKTLVEAARRAQ